jgi:Kef-type K+ transport system membrane component KefB
MRRATDHIRSESAVITLTLSFMCLMALVTDYIGVHVMLGASVAGILIGQSPHLKRQIEEQLRGLTVALFAPVFFAAAAPLGARADSRG